MRYKTFFTIGLAALLWTGVAHAQTFTSGPDPVQYTVVPTTPGPNEHVDLSLQGIGSFLGDATITWKENGKVVNSGVGLTNHSFTTGGVGTITRVNVTIVSATNGTLSHDFTFTPSVVYLTWEADTSVPNFYKGKSLYTSGSQIKVVAVPFVVSGHGLVPASQLSFQWRRNDDLVPEQSGMGKNVFVFNGNQLLGAEQVAVNVFLGTTEVNHTEISIPASNPMVLLYDRDPLRGELLERALPSSASFGANEITLQAEPYYFAHSSVVAGALQYTWTLNGQETTGPDSAKGVLTLRQTGQGTGSATVGINVQNTNDMDFFQTADESIQMTFGQTTRNIISTFLGI